MNVNVNSRSNPEVVDSISTDGSLIPFARGNAQWVIHGFN